MNNKLQLICLAPRPNPLLQGTREIKEDITCKECFKIICRGCGWEPNEQELIDVQTRKLMLCPLCGWKPGES